MQKLHFLEYRKKKKHKPFLSDRNMTWIKDNMKQYREKKAAQF